MSPAIWEECQPFHRKLFYQPKIQFKKIWKNKKIFFQDLLTPPCHQSFGQKHNNFKKTLSGSCRISTVIETLKIRCAKTPPLLPPKKLFVNFIHLNLLDSNPTPCGYFEIKYRIGLRRFGAFKILSCVIVGIIWLLLPLIIDNVKQL